MTVLRQPGDSIAAEKIIAWGRKVSRVRIVSGTSAHRAQSVYVWGMPAVCRIDKPWRLA
jgi:hypothetical protein